ncbi:monoacylglycerol lipase ABHD6 [Anolis carolinensis]|uniref:acylglycerol lipase n=1 Tax=Anolis carolinensis TaxID=28377 RepID=G1KLQ2_ANOCA|nr:PREDICTED: monoacylglycerol lipase ABHD6 [Anolis carolinensis]XP_016847181.1 PREDICTED: monoacylglycerol lipase ABHD6 [Anolis carolinensis]|eukprot:XP_016847180.1 PREDICTED: monoacylglycerol lipase ABHD6 [Anolis carolinensis]
MDLILLKIFLINLVTCFTLLLISLLTIYFLWPSKLMEMTNWFLSQKYGLKKNYVKHEGYQFCYYSQGKPGFEPSILLLHGFSLNKDMWLMSMPYFPKGTHSIFVDLPGHGETSCLPGDRYKAVDQAKRLHQFVECTGLCRTPFHLVGISMGGMIAGVYAALYPSDLCALSLLCPAGVKYPEDNVFMKHLKELNKNHKLDCDNPLVPLDVKGVRHLFKTGMFRSMFIPYQILKGLVKLREYDNQFYSKCFIDLAQDDNLYCLHDHINKITTPMQVIWGKDDIILDPSGAEILARAIPGTQVHLLDNCGHFILSDLPKIPIDLIMDFHTSVWFTMDKKLV